MYPEDRVLIAVMNRQRDYRYARDQHWYRIPQAKMTNGIQAEYIGFFLSRAFGDRNGGVHYFARVLGVELVYRRWILPDEPQRADERYFRVALGTLEVKTPPLLNTTKHRVAFIYTTWERFSCARTLAELYKGV